MFLNGGNMFLKCKLNKAQNSEEVEELFRKHKIYDFKKRIEILKKVMGNPEVFITVKDQSESELLSYYLTLRSMFITGSWRI